MRLDRLVAVAGDRPGLAGLERAPTRGADDLDDPTEIAAITLDSRAVEPGALFCCVTGAHTDGHDHARSAVAAGAVALLCERPLDLGVTELREPAVRRAMGPLAAAFHGDPAGRLDVVGITGTNGKTTTVHLLASILEAAGRPTEVIGTLTATRTTPEAPELQKRLAGALAAGRRAVAMEVSSHALVQHRVDGTRFAVAGFTNLSQDHLDYHGTMESYFQAKAMLFEPALSDRAVVDVDSAHGRLLRDAALVPTVGYSQADATDVVVSADGRRSCGAVNRCMWVWPAASTWPTPCVQPPSRPSWGSRSTPSPRVSAKPDPSPAGSSSWPPVSPSSSWSTTPTLPTAGPGPGRRPGAGRRRPGPGGEGQGAGRLRLRWGPRPLQAGPDG
ncbi:MAG: Mur ligase family protein [Acidimicrobiales bacterium]